MPILSFIPRWEERRNFSNCAFHHSTGRIKNTLEILSRTFHEQRTREQWTAKSFGYIPTHHHNFLSWILPRLVRDGMEDAIDIRRDAVWQKHSPETEVARRRLSIREWLSRKRVRRERRDKRDKRGGTLRRRRRRRQGESRRRKAVRKALPPASKLQSSARGSDRRPPINQMERRGPSSSPSPHVGNCENRNWNGVEKKKKKKESRDFEKGQCQRSRRAKGTERRRISR